MGFLGGRGAATVLAAALLGAGMAGCSEAVDEARTVQTHLGRVPDVVAVDVTTPTRNRTAAITVTYADDIERPAELATLITAIDDTATDLDYPAYRLTLVPSMAPDSALVVESVVRDRAVVDDALPSWFTVTSALLGAVTYDVQPDAETITVDAQGAAAHDVAEAQRIGHGTRRTTWVFRAESSTFTASGRLRPSDVALFQAVQRNAGVSGQPVSASSWQLDRRDDHVRLDLDVAFGTTPVPPAQLTVLRYSRTVAPLARVSLVALDRTRLPAYLTLHSGSDTFATWASGQEPGKGRDPLNRGWDVWLAEQAAAAT
jgi:hypothetical protein